MLNFGIYTGFVIRRSSLFVLRRSSFVVDYRDAVVVAAGNDFGSSKPFRYSRVR